MYLYIFMRHIVWWYSLYISSTRLSLSLSSFWEILTIAYASNKVPVVIHTMQNVLRNLIKLDIHKLVTLPHFQFHLFFYLHIDSYDVSWNLNVIQFQTWMQTGCFQQWWQKRNSVHLIIKMKNVLTPFRASLSYKRRKKSYKSERNKMGHEIIGRQNILLYYVITMMWSYQLLTHIH